MKRKTRITIGIILIVIGLVLLVIPQISVHLIREDQKKAVEVFQEIRQEELHEKAQREEVSFDFDAITSITVNQAQQNTIWGNEDVINTYRQDIVGQLIIESLDINLVIFNGINDAKLYVGVTTMKPGQVIGERNYSIAGHWSYNDGVLLSRLPDIEEGAIIKLVDQENTYEYKVYETALVLASDVHLIEDYMADNHGSPIVSLMSCWTSMHETHRWFAFGELINTIPN